MKKNLIIIALIFILPIIAYAILSETNSVLANKTVTGQPQIIKFSSKLCIDCKKLKKGFDELKPKYENDISIIEYEVQENNNDAKKAIDKYNISLVPTIIFVDKTGKEVRRTEGYVETIELQTYFDELLKK